MTRLSIAFCLLLAACLSAPPHSRAFADSDILFDDNFERLDPGWGDSSDVVFANSGKLTLKPKLGTSQAVQHQGVVVEDGSISVKIRMVKDDGKIQASGLVFWASDYQSYYVADITPDGRFAVTRWLKERWYYPVTYRKTDAIRKDYNQENEVRVVTKGSMATLFINGIEVVSIKGQPPKSGSMIGFYAESGKNEATTAEFSQLRVTGLPSQPAVATAPTTNSPK